MLYLLIEQLKQSVFCLEMRIDAELIVKSAEKFYFIGLAEIALSVRAAFILTKVFCLFFINC